MAIDGRKGQERGAEAVIAGLEKVLRHYDDMGYKIQLRIAILSDETTHILDYKNSEEY